MSLPETTKDTTRRSRPRDRKSQILTAASELFYASGYHNVSTEQIAAAVGITAGALYRHFRSKEDLLAAAVVDRFDRATADTAASDSQDLEEFVARIVESAAGRRELGVLWSRETRHLGPANRHAVRTRFYDFLRYFTGEIHQLRPELTEQGSEFIAWSTLAVLTSPSYHRTAVTAERLRSVLQQLALVACYFSPTADTGFPVHQTAAPASPSFASRRELLLVAASELFNTRGHQTVTMDEVGAAAGVTSTSVYRYFDTKADLLAAVVARAEEPLRLGIAAAIASSTTPAEALTGTIDAYIRFALDQHDLLGVLVSEVMNLPDGVRAGVKGAQHSYVAEWFRLVALAEPGLDTVEVRFRVHAALTVINDITRTRHLRERAGIAADLSRIAVNLVSPSLTASQQTPTMKIK